MHNCRKSIHQSWLHFLFALIIAPEHNWIGRTCLPLKPCRMVQCRVFGLIYHTLDFRQLARDVPKESDATITQSQGTMYIHTWDKTSMPSMNNVIMILYYIFQLMLLGYTPSACNHVGFTTLSTYLLPIAHYQTRAVRDCLLRPFASISECLKNIERHSATTIVSWPNPKQWITMILRIWWW